MQFLESTGFLFLFFYFHILLLAQTAISRPTLIGFCVKFVQSSIVMSERDGRLKESGKLDSK